MSVDCLFEGPANHQAYKVGYPRILLMSYDSPAANSFSRHSNAAALEAVFCTVALDSGLHRLV